VDHHTAPSPHAGRSKFIRQFENRFVTSENSFIDLAAWDRCVDPKLGAPPAEPFLPIFVGVDASTKRDSPAVVAVAFDQRSQRVRLVFHRIFQPSQAEPLDFELSIEATLLDLAKRFRIKKILYDPYQLAASMQRLAKQHLAVEEYPQTLDRLTAMSQQLYDLIMGQAFIAYPSEAMRLAVSRTVAVENSRGWRISKEKASHKIDCVVALALACFAAVRAQGESSFDHTWGWVRDNPIGATPQTDEQRKAAAKAESEAAYRTRLHSYLRAYGAFGWR
jgi:phage terminase large subunit-like protein